MSLNPISIATRGEVCGGRIDPIALATRGEWCLSGAVAAIIDNIIVWSVMERDSMLSVLPDAKIAIAEYYEE